MIGRRSMLVFVGSVAAVMLSGCDRLANTTITGKYLPNYKYKLTVEVDTPEGVKSGYSVIEVIKPWRRGSTSRGQAVAVDLPRGQTLFVLLRSEQKGDWADDAMEPVWPSTQQTGDEEQDVTNLLSAAKEMGRVPLPRIRKLGRYDEMNHTPYFVRFKNIADPMSVEQVNPNNLDKIFGNNIKLKGLFVEITDEPVTSGIENRLGWLENIRKYRRNPENQFTSTLPDLISAGLRSK
jgi:hypothetical protein